MSETPQILLAHHLKKLKRAVGIQVLKLPLEPDELNLPIIGENLNRHLELEDVPERATACLEGG